MGKSKKGKDKTKTRVNPIAKQVKPPSDPELAAIREQKILPVLKDLTSIDLKARSAAALAITNIIQDTKCRKLLLREKLVTILLEQTLTDLNLETKAAGWGILRNLAIEEEADFCVHLYRLDILTAIDGMIRNVSNYFFVCYRNILIVFKIIETIESSEFLTTPKAHKNLVWNLTGSVVTLLTTLAEAQEEIIQAISKLPNLPNFLFGLLGLSELPPVVYEDTLTCLIALTEDNQDICQQVVENKDWLSGLVQLKDGGGMKAVGACGVLHNLFSTMHWFDHDTPVEGASDGNLVPALTRCIEIANTHEGQSNGNSSNATPDQVLQLALRITASIATSIQEALEEGNRKEEEFEGFDEDEMVIEDGSDDENDEGPDPKSHDDDEFEEEHEMNEDEINADMELVAGDDSENETSQDEQLTLNQLVRTAAPVILEYAKPPQNDSAEASETRTTALSVLNNISWTVSSIDFASGHLSSLQSAWSEMAQQIWLQAISPVLASDTADIALASSIASLAFGVAQSVQGKVPIQGEEQRKFMALYQASKTLPKPETEKTNGKSSSSDQEDAFQGLGVKCIGVLGRLALNPAPIALNRDIGVFFLTSLPDAAAAETVEILNQLFDIYADKEYSCDEAVFWADGFYQHLDQALPKIRKLMKGVDKRRFTELRARGDEAVANLVRFLKYKKEERRGGK